MIWLQFAVVMAAMFLGARKGGVFLGMAGGMGLTVLVFVFGLAPSSPPIDVMLIIFAVVTAAATLQASGGMDYLVRVAEYFLRSHPQQITFFAPFIAYVFTFMAGTGNVAYSIMPVIAEVARESGVRPERPMAISVIASQQAITASPISAATAAMVALMAPLGVGMGTILAVCIPATLVGVLAGCLYSCRVGKELADDPEYRRRLDAGLIPPVEKKEPTTWDAITATPEAKRSVALFLLGAVCIIIMGTFPDLRPNFSVDGKTVKLTMTHTIEMVMLVIAGIMVLACRVDVGEIIGGSVFKAGMMGLVCIFGLAWLGDTFVSNNLSVIKDNVQSAVKDYPWIFAFALFAVSALIMSQAATTRALIPLGIGLGMPSVALIGVWPAVNGYFFIPNYATVIAGVAFDVTGTTRIGKFVFNHSYMIPGLITTVVSVATAFALGSMIV
jgi:anaerobic C4-dicarboxylate transporter-like protein